MGIMQKYYKRWNTLLNYNDMDIEAHAFSAYLFAASLIVGGVASVLFLQGPLMNLLAVVATILIMHIVIYAYLVLGANSRAGKVEEVLPDFLSLMASNIRSGLTPDKALVISARDEFGPLSRAINKAGKRSVTGMPIERVMMSISENIKSNTLEKTMQLIVEGLHSGGDMSDLLEKTALDIRKFRSMKREINSVILSYVLFIVAAVTFGAPLLYGVSSFLVDIMLAIRGKLATSGTSSAMSGSIGVFKGKLMLTSEGVALFAGASIIVTVFFGCMAVGVMSSGKRLEGMKYFPILVVLGLGVFFAIRFGLTSVLGGMLKGGF